MSIENKYKYDYERNRNGIYVPVLKGKDFNPSPVAGRIPDYANGDINPKCIGTDRYNSFWDEQFDICVNGYNTGGLFIPGPYYFFLNFTIIKGLLGPMYPWFMDLHYDLEYTFDQIRKYNGAGYVGFKARREGLSEINQSDLQYGIRFTEGFKAAVTAGLETYTRGIRNKFDYATSRYPEAFRLNISKDNVKEFSIGYDVESNIGGYVEEGYGGQVLWETMFDNPNKLEGEYFHIVIMEEGGQYPKLKAVHDSIRPALEFGSKMAGMFRIYGTGGNILSTSKDFKYFYDNADKLGFVKQFIPGTRMYFPFFISTTDNKVTDPDTKEEIYGTPNLKKMFKGRSKAEVMGCEDLSAASDYIDKKIAQYAQLSDKRILKNYLKARPRTEEEGWSSGGKNNFNDDVLIKQLLDIEGKHEGMVKPYILEFVMVDDGSGIKVPKIPFEVMAIPAKPKDPKWKKVWILEHPIHGTRNLDIGGIDGYNQDQTQTSDSLGSMVVLRQTDVYPTKLSQFKGKFPVCLYYDRPPRKEQFFDICLKIAIYYDLIQNTMIAAESELCIDHFIQMGFKKMLSPRPRNFDSPNSKQVHLYGVKVQSRKDELMGILQGYVDNYGDLIFFPEILRDFLAYDEEFIGTDWDSVDALACCLIRILDRKFTYKVEKKDPNKGRVRWEKNSDGNFIPVEQISDEKKKELVNEGKGGFIVLG
jgi:hypothetical protein